MWLSTIHINIFDCTARPFSCQCAPTPFSCASVFLHSISRAAFFSWTHSLARLPIVYHWKQPTQSSTATTSPVPMITIPVIPPPSTHYHRSSTISLSSSSHQQRPGLESVDNSTHPSSFCLHNTHSYTYSFLFLITRFSSPIFYPVSTTPRSLLLLLTAFQI